MLEDDGFVRVGRVTLQPPFTIAIHIDRREAQSWGPAIYAFRMGGEVMRIGKTESTLSGRMLEHERHHSRALAGNFQKGATNPWEAFEFAKELERAWRRRVAGLARLKRGRSFKGARTHQAIRPALK